MACFARHIIGGTNIKDIRLRAETVQLYIKAVNALFVARGFPAPVDFADKCDPTVTLIHNLETWQTIPNRRNPLTPQMFAEMMRRAELSGDDSFEAATCDWSLVGRYQGLRTGEFAQKKQFVQEFHKTPQQTTILKAFCRDDIKVIDCHDDLVQDPTKLKPGRRFKYYTSRHNIQKNRRNGQVTGWAFHTKNKKSCPGLAMNRILSRHKRLRRPRTSALAVYRERGVTRYLTANKIGAYFKKIAKIVHPHLTDEELSKFSGHSIRVTAAVLLHQFGKDGPYIQVRLRWEGDSYKLYLRNTETLMWQHVDAIGMEDEKIAALLQLDSDVVPDTVAYDTPLDNTLGRVQY